MDTSRFLAFLQTFDRIVKNIKRKEMSYMREHGLRGVHTNCLLYMDNRADGVTVTQLAKECDSDKALVSRTVKELCQDGFIVTESETIEKNYNKKYFLSEKGRELLEGLKKVICGYVAQARTNISPDEMKIFYSVLGKFERNIAQITQ